MGLNTNSSFIPSSCFCKDTMNPCKIQIFRYSFEGVTVLPLKGNIVEQQMKLCRNFLEECRSLNCWCDETEEFSHRSNGRARNDTDVSWKSVWAACPCSSVAITRRFANAENNRNNTIPNNQKEPTLLWVGSLLLEDSWTAENGYYRCCQEKNVDTKP